MTTKTRATIAYFVLGAISLAASYLLKGHWVAVWCVATAFGIVLGMLLDRIK